MNGKCPIRSLPISEWPRADQVAWAQAVQPADLLDTPGPLTDVIGQRVKMLQAAFGRWIGFVSAEVPGGPGNTGLDHFSKENLSGFVDRLRTSLASQSVATYVMNLAIVVHAICPGRDFDSLWEAAKRLQRSARPVRDKRRLLKPAQELYQTGLDLLCSAESMIEPHKAATAFRDGLMIALLATRPVRLANLAAIEIGRHLDRRGEEYWLIFRADEVKTRRHLEFPLPLSLADPLVRYLVRHRPILMARRGRWYRGPHSGLWVSRDGSHLAAKQIGHIIQLRTEERFGCPIGPHLFRSAAATSVAIEDPGHVGIIANILGHYNLRTAERYYNLAGSLEAARRFQAELQARRMTGSGRSPS